MSAPVAHTGILTSAQSAESVVRLAILDPDGPTGGFHSAEGPIPW